MPKKVDHDERRTEIAEALWRIATSKGLQGVTFREVALEAGVSVSLVQHYFGSKEQLLIWSVDRNTARMGERITRRLRRGEPNLPPQKALSIIATSFLPTDPESRAGMLVYHAFAAAALTDPALQTTEAFGNAHVLLGHLAAQLRSAPGTKDDRAARRHAEALLALVLGLSLAVLLGQTSPKDATAIVDEHIDRLFTS